METNEKRAGWPAVAALLTLVVACGGAEVEPAADVEPAAEETPSDMAAVLDGSVPINDLPNPYSSIDGWGTLPDGREWGSTAGVDIDPDGSLWAIDRCGGNSCAGSDLDPILKFDADGNVTTAIGGGLFLFPHGLHVIDGIVEAYPEGSNPEGVAVDPQGNVYGSVVSGGGALVRSSM